MIKVLGTLAFGRAPKRAVKLLVFTLCAGIIGLVAPSSFAAGTTPTLLLAQTADRNADGYLDAVIITFDTVMDASVVPTGFTVSGYTLDSPVAQWANATQGTATQLILRLRQDQTTGGDTSIIPAINYARSAAAPARAAGPAGTEMAAGTNIASGAGKSRDGAGPVLLRVQAADFGGPNTFVDPADEMRFTFSEPVVVNGATAQDRIKSLDAALKFSSINSCPGAVIDGTATNNLSNFPVPASATSDSIIEPVSGKSSRVIRVRKGTPEQNGVSTIRNVAIPGLCGVGIDGTNGTGITDTAPTPNNSVSQDFEGQPRYRRDIDIAPAALFFDLAGRPGISTQDLTPGNGDGFVDSVKVVFDHAVVDSTATDGLASLFSVKLGNTVAAVTGVAPADAVSGDDAGIIVKFNGVTWGGGVKPQVSFAGSCTLRTKAPTAGYTACVDSFGTTAVGIQALDGVPPAVVSSKALDTNTNGSIDKVEITLTEKISGGATEAGWTVGSAAASGINAPAEATVVTLSVTETSALRSGATPSVSYNPTTGNMTDLAGAELKAQTFQAGDGASPRAVAATVLATSANGSTDRVTVEFSEAVVDSSLDLSQFTVGGQPATGFSTSAIDSGVAGDNKITLAFSSAGTGKVDVGYTGNIADAASNVTQGGFTLAAVEAIDAAKPVVTSITTTPVSPYGTGTVTVSAAFSEALDGNVAPVVKIGDKAVTPVVDGEHNAAGFRTADLARWDGTITFESADCASQSGCAANITVTGFKDASANDGVAATPVAVVLDTVAPAAPTDGNAWALQEAGYANLANNAVGSHTKNLKITAGIVAGQVVTLGQTSGGTAELLLDGAAFNPALKISGIDANASTLQIQTAFASAQALQSMITEGTHTLAIRLCDSAANCSTSENFSIIADYTPVGVTLIGPNSGEFTGGSTVCINWDGNELDNGFSAVALRYSLNGGQTYPHLIAQDLPIDGTLPCGSGAGAGYSWTLPGANTDTLRVQAVTSDVFTNAGAASSATNLKVVTITQTVLTLTSNVSGVVFGQGATLTGSLTGNGFAVAGKQVEIHRKPAGATTFSRIATVATDANGKYVYTMKPGANAEYRAVFTGVDPYLASQSAAKRITVAVQVTSTVNGTSFVRGATYQIRGSVLPAHTGKVVWLQAYISGQWKTLSTQTLGTTNAYSFGYRSAGAGKLLFRVAFPTQDADHAWNISQRYLVSWR